MLVPINPADFPAHCAAMPKRCEQLTRRSRKTRRYNTGWESTLKLLRHSKDGVLLHARTIHDNCFTIGRWCRLHHDRKRRLVSRSTFDVSHYRLYSNTRNRLLPSNSSPECKKKNFQFLRSTFSLPDLLFAAWAPFWISSTSVISVIRLSCTY